MPYTATNLRGRELCRDLRGECPFWITRDPAQLRIGVPEVRFNAT
jgi:hypothetical protein